MHEYADELYHWKYIKRVKQNGKWRYYYTEEQLKKDLKSVAQEGSNIVNNINTLLNNRYEKAKSGDIKVTDVTDAIKRPYKALQNTVKKGTDAAVDFVVKQTENLPLDQIESRYGDTVKRITDDAKNKVEDGIDNAKSKVEEGKDYVKNKVKKSKDQLKDDLGYDEKEAYEQALANEAYVEKKHDAAFQNFARSFMKEDDFDDNPRLTRVYEHMTDKNGERLNRSSEALERARKATDITFSKYERTPIGQIDKLVKDSKRIAEKVIDAVKYDFLYEFEFK